MAPLIGITTSSRVNPNSGWLYNVAYVGIMQAVADAGGLPVLIPVCVNEATLRGIYRRLDGLLLPGGGDVDPRYYGAPAHPQTGTPDDARDAAELLLARWAVEDDLPVFGICRGHQVLNVALGGTLIQDIPSQLQTPLVHDVPKPAPRSTIAHEVEIVGHSRLARILEATRVPVNSLHHQSIERPAAGLIVTACSRDGVIEATELPDRRFVLTVQWHPEDLYLSDAAMKRLFSAFVEAANGHSAA